MPRTNINKQTEASADQFPWSTSGLALNWTAADAANGNETTSCGEMLLIARNTGAGARTVTIESSPDNYGREGDVAAQSIAAGATRIFRLVKYGWEQDDAGTGKFWFNGEHAEVLFALVQLRN